MGEWSQGMNKRLPRRWTFPRGVRLVPSWGRGKVEFSYLYQLDRLGGCGMPWIACCHCLGGPRRAEYGTAADVEREAWGRGGQMVRGVGRVRTVRRGWQQLRRINAFSRFVFACVAIPAQMKEIQIVIDSSPKEECGDLVGLHYIPTTSFPAYFLACLDCKSMPWSLPGLLTIAWSQPLPSTLLLGQPGAQLKMLMFLPALSIREARCLPQTQG